MMMSNASKYLRDNLQRVWLTIAYLFICSLSPVYFGATFFRFSESMVSLTRQLVGKRKDP